MAHKHWPKDHPFYEFAATHDSTKKDCDRQWTEYMHGHEGQPCVKEVKPGNKTATCVLIGQNKRTKDEERLARETAAFQEFIEKEERRIASVLDGRK